MAQPPKSPGIQDSLQEQQIQKGFESGNVLVWNGREFKACSKKEAKQLGPECEKTLEKVSEKVVCFFKEHKDISPTQTLQKIEARVSAYKGWYGWVLWFFFQGNKAKAVIEKFEPLIKFLKAESLEFNQKAYESAPKQFVYNPTVSRDISAALPPTIAPGALVEIPLAGIKMGLPNPSNSCWFNSVLKFLAATPVYDQGFNQNNSALSQHFRRAINELRSGRPGLMQRGILEQLTASVEQKFPRFILTRQCDSDEFIRALMSDIWSESAHNFPKFPEVQSYQVDQFFSECTNEYHDRAAGVEDYAPATKSAESDNYKGVVILHADKQDLLTNDPIDLNELLSQESDLRVRADSGEEADFVRRLRFTHLPDQLVVNFQRAVQVGGFGENIVCRRPIKFNAGREVVLELYRPAEGGKLEKDRDVRYRVEAAITHSGRDGSGHYICEVRNPDGSHTHHSDQTVREERTPIGAQASVLYLRKITE